MSPRKRKKAAHPRPERARRGAVGHGPKIREALDAIVASGTVVPSNLRPHELHERIKAVLRLRGYATTELPSRQAIERYLAAQRESELPH